MDNEGSRNAIRSERSAGKRGHGKDEKHFAREPKTLEKKIKKEKERVEKEVWHLSNQEFYSKEDAVKAAQEREKRWKYHEIIATAMETKRKRENGGRGRPRKDEPLLGHEFPSSDAELAIKAPILPRTATFPVILAHITFRL